MAIKALVSSSARMDDRLHAVFVALGCRSRSDEDPSGRVALLRSGGQMTPEEKRSRRAVLKRKRSGFSAQVANKCSRSGLTFGAELNN